MLERISIVILAILELIAAFLIGSLIVGGIVWLLWKPVVVALFPTVAVIGYWQAVGLSIMCLLLFKSTNTSTNKS